MWYKISKVMSSYEDKILRIDAENFVRRRLSYAGQNAPSAQEIKSRVEMLIKKLESHYGSLNNVRLHMPGESLAPAFEMLGPDALKGK